LAEIDGHGHAVQRHGAEVGRARLVLQGGEVQPRVPEQLFGDGALNPPLGRHPLLVGIGADDVELGRGRGILQRRPGIARAGRVVDDQDARRPMRRRDLELIGPAAIEGHGLTVELARDRMAFGRAEVGVVDQHQRDLALQVDALEVVPAALGRIDAIADEDQGGVAQGDALHRPVGRDDDVFGALKLGRAAVGGNADGGGAVLTGAADLGDLHPRPVRAAGLKTERLELLAQPFDGAVLAGRDRGAALERVGGEHAGRLVQPGRVDAAGRGAGLSQRRGRTHQGGDQADGGGTGEGHGRARHLGGSGHAAP
uniref:Phenol hydroxylase n=1 Tax=Parastrongyloides trichosuri TaxID=131310 RepID=A0A0N4Z5P0_PARTI